MLCKYLAIIVTVILTSCYFFPFDIVFLPNVNTKLIMAITSLVILSINLAKRRKGVINTDLMLLCFFALLVSFTSLFSVFFNNTRDFSYVTYIISMLVWMGGAYTLVTIIKMLHGNVTVSTIVYYLIGACVMQCFLALAINRNHDIETFCNCFCTELSDIKNYMDNGRLYGVGCAFDPAGLRLSAVLIMMSYFFPYIIVKDRQSKLTIIAYTLAFAFIAVVGNMIARSTTIGLLIGLIYILYRLKLYKCIIDSETFSILKWALFIFIVSIIILVPLYYLDSNFRADFRFGFEGFFSLFEKGKWDVRSNNILFTMYRFPETFKTWLVGDGYFFNTNLDPYYTGKEYKEYYMATDVGYLRFIYYFGIIGLIAFVIFMCKATYICMHKYNEYQVLFFLMLILQLTIWFKVASDIFCVYALFLVANNDIKTEPATK